MSQRWNDGLEGAARRIAEIDHSPLRVLAGPGTGKTFTLIRRVARLLHDGAKPGNVMVCTFTRTAARDLQRELDRLGVEGANKVHAGTIHAFCFGLLSRADVLELTERVPRPLLKFEERFLLEDLRGGAFGSVKACDTRLRSFSAAWARLTTDIPGWPRDPVDQAFQRELLAWLRFHKAMVIGEMITETLRYLRDNPTSADRGRFDHVLVDEYQDLNRAEQVLLDYVAEGGTLTIVGDEDQAIYTFRYAHPQGIGEFDRTHSGTHDEQLVECRRCPSLVVEMAKSLISHNVSRTSRALIPQGTNPRGEVHVVQWHSLEEEWRGIAEFIIHRVRDGKVKPGRVLILAPRRQCGYGVRDALNDLGIPAHSFFHEQALAGDPKKLSKSEAQRAFTLLTLLAKPTDRVALRCWCGFSHLSLRRDAWADLRAYCDRTGEDPFSALRLVSTGQIRPGRAAKLGSSFDELTTLLAALRELDAETLVHTLFPRSAEWAEPFRTILSRLDPDDLTVEKMYDALRVGITQPELPTDVDYVRVMSLHKSKGLTADLVVVLTCIQGLIPYIDPDLPELERPDALEEQRRLFYVAITRTTGTLVLSSVTRLPRDLAHNWELPVRGGNMTHIRTQASQFMAELGPACPAAVRGDTILKAPTSL